MKSRNEFTTNEEYNEYLRIYFTGLAMQGMIANTDTYVQDKSVIAKLSIEHADELLKQLENEQ